MTDLIVTAELARCIEQRNLEFTVSRFRGLESVNGNPLGVEIRQIGRAVALTMQHPDPPIPNLVVGLDSEQVETIPELLGPLHAKRTNYLLIVAPPFAGEDLLRALADFGLYQSGFMTELYGEPQTAWPAPPPGILVREYHGPELGEFARFVTELENIPEAERPFWEGARTAEFAEWRGYVAFLDGRAQAKAAMAVRDSTATLGFASTPAPFRGRGLQTALLHRRLADASRLGCKLVISGCNPNTTSERNQQRAGLRVAYSRVTWSPLYS